MRRRLAIDGDSETLVRHLDRIGGPATLSVVAGSRPVITQSAGFDYSICVTAEVVIPPGAFVVDVEDGVAVPKRSRDSEPVLVNGESVDDNPVDDVPLKLVKEAGIWRVENCEQYVR